MYIQPEKTNEELDKEQASCVVGMANDTAYKLQRLHEDGFRAVWGYTNPQGIFDNLGSQAYKIFQDSKEIQTLLAKVIPDYEFLTPPYEYTINQDGTVTVGDKIE